MKGKSMMIRWCLVIIGILLVFSSGGVRGELRLEPKAILQVEGGDFQYLEKGAAIFSDRNYTVLDLPEGFSGMQFAQTSIDSTAAVCREPGFVYVLTPAPQRNPDSVEPELLVQGFVKTSVPEFVFMLVNGHERSSEMCSVYQKQVNAGETISFGKWGVLVCSAGVSSIDFERETEIMLSQVYPEDGILFSPGGKYDEGNENYQGMPSLGVAPNGRIWVGMGRSKEFEVIYPYLAVKTSGNGGVSWSGTKVVLEPDGDGPESVSEGTMWLDPLKRLWIIFNYRGGRTDEGDGKRNVVMGMFTENPDSETPAWSHPQPIALGWTINKPIVISDGRWLMPSYFHVRWNEKPNIRLSESRDNGKTWKVISSATVPPMRRNHDEPSLLEKENGDLHLFVRTEGHGIGRFISTDGGYTWSEFEDYMLNATSRFQLRRLQSGNIILVKNGPLDKRYFRSHLTAYLSQDDGETWGGGLLLDARSTVSYPDVDQDAEGNIYVAYDWNRSRDKNILMSVFSESDILQKQFVSESARNRILVDKQTGYNPEVWLTEGHYIGLRSDANAAEFQEGASPQISESNGDIRCLEKWTYLFSDHSYYLQNTVSCLEGKRFVYSPMQKTKARFSTGGMVYVLTPALSRNAAGSQEQSLLEMGFKKTRIKEFVPFLLSENVSGDTYATKEVGAVRAARTSEACSVFQKQVLPGETVEFGGWGLLCF